MHLKHSKGRVPQKTKKLKCYFIIQSHKIAMKQSNGFSTNFTSNVKQI